MSQEFQKKKQKDIYDREKKKPVIRSRAFRDELVAGFVDLQTGEFTEVMRICNSRDMDRFMEKYDISVAEIATE